MEDTNSPGSKPNQKAEEKEQQPLPQLHFAVRSKKGVQFCTGPPAVNEIKVLSENSNVTTQYSKDGSLLAIIDPANIYILDANTNEVIQKIDYAGVVAFSFSPLAKYFVTFNRLTQQLTEDNLIIWESKTGKQAFKLTQKNYADQLWPLIKWSEDDVICARVVTNEVHFWNTSKDFALDSKLVLKNLSQCTLSPNGRDSLKVAIFVPEKQGSPAQARIYRYLGFENPICSKSFFKAQEADLLWNSLGSALLVRTHTDMDKTGKSYYGETGLYFLQADGKFESNIQLKKEGPIYDCVWSPNGKEFLVIYGFSPAKSTLFNLQCEPLVDFGEAARNTAKWSPSGRVLCIAGFGNLSGQMDFWDRKKIRKLGTASAHTTSHYEWSPDGQFLLTAVLFPRMRIDNEFRVWNFNGTMVHRQQYGGTELYQVNWKPIPLAQLPEPFRNPNKLVKPAVQPVAEPEPAPKPAKYVHPNFRGGSTSLQRNEDGPVKYKREPAPKPKPKELPPGYDPEEDKEAKKKKKPITGKKEQPQKGKPQAQPAFSIDEPDFGQ